MHVSIFFITFVSTILEMILRSQESQLESVVINQSFGDDALARTLITYFTFQHE